MEDGFEEFWAFFPKRKGTNSRHVAEQKYNRIIAQKIATHADIMAGVTRYRADLERTGKLHTEYVAMAATWLNQRRWEVQDSVESSSELTWVPYDKATPAHKKWWGDMLKKPYVQPHMLRLTPYAVQQLKAEGYL